jgi:hypothetical protein
MSFKIELREGREKKAGQQLVLQRAFQDHVKPSYNMDVKICAEGDSWCNLLWPVSGYPKTLVDWLAERYYTSNIAWPGDKLEEVVNRQQYEQPIKSGIFDYFIISGGGVDFFSDLKVYLRPFKSVKNGSRPEDFIIESEVVQFLTDARRRFNRVIKNVSVWSKKTKILSHGYDHAVPKPGGVFLGKRFEALGYNTSSRLPREIVRVVIDRYYDLLHDIERHSGGKFTVVDCRGACTNKWFDELHGNKNATRIVADRFAVKMKR